MRIARFSLPDSAADAGAVRFGLVEGDPEQPEAMVIVELEGHPFTPERRTTGRAWPLADVRLLAPVLPSKVVAVGRNYADHAKELGNEVPAVPLTFLKPSTSVIGPNETIAYPVFSQDVQHEAELAVVIGKPGRGIKKSQAFEHVFGYTIVNDFTARDLQKLHRQWFLGKSLDGFCPMGPYVTTFDEVDARNLDVKCWVNGELRQDANTSQLIFDIPTLIETISAGMALLPGDIIATGTPAGVGIGYTPPRFVRSGDVIRIEIQGLGSLENTVA